MRDLSPNQKAVLLTSAVFIFSLLYTGVAQTSTSTDNWSKGTFKDTTADREDNSGILGLGYKNGTAGDNLIGYWRFDRESGAFPDYSGNDLTGDIYGADRAAEGILGTTGARFSSNSDEAVILDNSDLDLEDGFTLSTWAKMNENIDINPTMSQNPSIYQKGSAYNLKIENPKTIAYSTGSEIVFLDSSGQKDTVTATANAIGDLRDFDNDQELEVPFVDGNNNLRIIDRNGNTETLVSGGVRGQNTVLGTGDLSGNGPDSIFYLDTTDSTINEYDTTDDSNTDHGITATAISGVEDYDGDGNKEIVYLDSKQELSYWDSTDLKTSTGKIVTKPNNYRYWIGGEGVNTPSIGKKEEGTWSDLSSKTDSPAEPVYAGTVTENAYYVGGGAGEVTKWDGTFTDISPSATNQIGAISSQSSEILVATQGGSIGEIYLRNTTTGTWTQPNTVGENVHAAANSYTSSDIEEFYLLGHNEINNRGTKYYLTRYDSSGTTAINSGLFQSSVEAIGFNNTHYLAGSSGGNLGIYDGSTWNQITFNGNTASAIEWGSIDSDSFWLVGDGNGNIIQIQENGSSTNLGSSPDNVAIRSIEYSNKEEKFLIGDDNGNTITYDSGGLTQSGNTVFSGSLNTLLYNPSSSIKKLGKPSDLEGDGNVEVPIINSDNNIELINSDGTSEVVESNYGSASATPLGVLDWTGNPDQEILHVDSSSGELKTSTVGGSVSTVRDSSGNTLTGIDTEAGIAAGSRPVNIPVLELNGGLNLNREGQSLGKGSWTQLSITYNSSTGEAGLFFDEQEVASGNTGGGTVNRNSDDFKIANGQIDANIDETQIYNKSSSTIINNRLLNSASDSTYEGSFTTEVYNPEGKVSWDNLELSRNIPSSTSLTAEVEALDALGGSVGSENISNPQEGNSSLESLPNARKFQITFSGTSDSVLDTWEIFNSKVYYEKALKANNLNAKDSDTKHAYNISAVGTHADADDDIAGCTVKYSPDGDPSFYNIENYGGTVEENRSFGTSKEFACNSTINTDLSGIGYGSGTTNSSFKIIFEDQQGYAVETKTNWRVLPNREPNSPDTTATTSSSAHSFDYTAYADDPDKAKDEISSATIYAEDPDGNTEEFTFDTSSLGNGGQDHDASASTTIDNSINGFEVGEEIDIWTEFADKAGATVQSSTRTQTIPNQAPTVTSGPSFTDNNGHRFDITAVAKDVEGGEDEIQSCTVYASDGDGNSISYSSNTLDTGYGTTDEAQCSATVGDSIEGFEVGETITTRVMFTDKHGAESSNSTDFHTIPNNDPSPAEGLSLNVDDVDNITDHTPVLEYTNPNDVDEDSLELDVLVGDPSDPSNLERVKTVLPEDHETGSSVELGINESLSNGERYAVVLEACDAYGGCATSSATEFQMNERPTVDSFSINTSNAKGGEEVKLEANVTDPTGSVEQVNFTAWNESNNQKVIDGEGTLSNGIWESESFTVDAEGDYNYSLTATDSFEETTATGSFQPENAVPEIISGLEFSNSEDKHSFNASAAVSDADGESDIEGYNITLSDGETTISKSRDVNSGFGDNESASANFSRIDASTAESFEIGESIDVQIEFYDSSGSTASTSTRSNEIPNKAPTIDSLNIDPENSVETTDDLEAIYSISDPEGDSIDSRFYRWVRNGEDTSETSTILDSSETSKGENWTIRLRAEDEYGALSDQVTADYNITIQNSAPEIVENISFDNRSKSHSFDVSAAAYDANNQSDIEKCNITYSDGQSNSNTIEGNIDTSFGSSNEIECRETINASDETWIQPLDTLEVNITFKDSDGGNISSASSNTIPNSKPNIKLENPTREFNTSNPNATFNWNGEDADNDDLKYIFRLYNGSDYEVEKNLSSESFEATELEDGDYKWNVTVTDLYNEEIISSNNSATRTLTVDTSPPVLDEENVGIEVINSTRDSPLQNQSVKCYSRWSDNYELDRVEISDNETDVTETAEGPWANRTIPASELEAGPASCEFTAFDHLNNSQTNQTSFDVEDIEKPNITGFKHSPSSQDNLDPKNEITVNATVEDNFKINNVTFNWRKQGGTWNETQAGTSQASYSTSFTPPEEGTYDFNYTAIDPDGNRETVKDSVEVDWEYTWTAEPSEFEGSSTLENNLVDPRPLTIKNKGDFPLEYDLQAESESNLDLSIDKNSIEVPVGETKSIGVEASLENTEPDDEGIYSFMIFAQPKDSNASPQEKNISGQATFTLDAPFLTINRGTEFPLSINTGTSGVELPVEIENDGSQEAKNTDVSYDIPDNWESSGSLSSDLGNISTGETSSATTSVDIPGDIDSGTYTVNITASTSERTFEESFDVDINSNETTVVEEDGGGGGFGGGGGGPTSQEQVEQRSDQIFNTSESFEIVRGEDQNFTVEFQNPTQFNLTNITANVEGIQSQYLNLANPDLGRVDINQSKNITVRITAPEYFQTGNYDLSFNITGKGIDGEGPYADYFDFTLNKDVSLGVRAIPRDNASEMLNKTRELVRQMEEENFTSDEIEEIASQAEQSLESGDYSSVRQSYEEAQNRYRTARSVRNGLEELESQINSAEASGLSVGRARQVASLAEAALDRGAYSTAADRLEEAQSIYQLETAGEVNWIYEIRSNWKKILASLIALSIAGFLVRLRYKLYKIRKRLRELESEEKSIEDLKIQKQKKAFEEKDISLSEYEDSVDDYNEQIVNIIEERVELETEKANLTNFKRRDSLAQERDQLQDLIAETQRDYVEGAISDDEIYQEKVEELTSRLSEIEGEIAEIDAEAKVRSQSSIGRLLERIPVISSGGKIE